MSGKKSGLSQGALKSSGRQMAKADLQKSSSAAPKKFAGGGAVRGGGAAVKGKKFEGCY